MSDSMAFLAGVAFAGIAALLLLKGVGNPNPSYSANSLPPPPPSVMPSAMPLPLPPSSQTVPSYNSEQQRQDIEQLKAQLDRQQMDTQLLKEQLRSQQLALDSANAQFKTNALNPQCNVGQGLVTAQQPTNSILWGILWALAGIILTIVVGIVLVAAFIVIGQQQQRQGRTVQVIQPFNPSEQFGPYRRRSEFLPPRSKRVDPTEYDR